MPEYIDQLGRSVSITHPLQRIVSLVPSQTELLFELGLEHEVAGITKFCVHPEHWFRSKPRVGGTKTLNLSAIERIQPDLVIANKEENVKEQVDELAKKFPVWISDVNNLDEAIDMIRSIGLITETSARANELITDIAAGFAHLPAPAKKATAVYLIWKEPYMTVGGDTFIGDMLRRCGLKNWFENSVRYPEISIDDIVNHSPELLLLSSEPYPFKQMHIDEWQLLLPATSILLVDGEMFSWYGSRLTQSPEYFMQLLKYES